MEGGFTLQRTGKFLSLGRLGPFGHWAIGGIWGILHGIIVEETFKNPSFDFGRP